MRRILPEDVASVEAVLAAMPEQVAGLSRLPGGPNEADYEGDALVTVMRLGTPTENMTATNALGQGRITRRSDGAGSSLRRGRIPGLRCRS